MQSFKRFVKLEPAGRGWRNAYFWALSRFPNPLSFRIEVDYITALDLTFSYTVKLYPATQPSELICLGLIELW